MVPEKRKDRGEVTKECGGNTALAGTVKVENVVNRTRENPANQTQCASSSSKKNGHSLLSTACLISQTHNAVFRALREHHSAHKIYSRENNVSQAHWQPGMGSSQRNNNHWVGNTHSLLCTPPPAALQQALLRSSTSWHRQLLRTRKFTREKKICEGWSTVSIISIFI